MMKKILHILLLTLLVGSIACTTPKEYKSPATLELIEIVEANPETKILLEKAIAQAATIVNDPDYNPAQTLDQYYDYIEWSSKAMPWDVIKATKAPKLYEKIDQGIAYFYFILDQPLEELEGKNLYYPSLQYVEPIRSWVIKYAKGWGEFLSTPESWNEEYYKYLCSDERFGLNKGWYEDPSNWHSFNDFFARYLSSPAARPIAEPANNNIVASPADSKPQGVWEIDDNSYLTQKGGVLFKSQYFNSIEALLGPNCAYGKAFAGGTLTHSFLDINDYHRYHFPLSGTIREIEIIPAEDAAGGLTLWDPEAYKYVLHCNTPGWQMIETRGRVILETPDYGLVALMPIGMSQVSSVNFENQLAIGQQVNKGDMLGYFLFGGSDFVIIFQEGVKFDLTVPEIAQNKYQHLMMGQELGRLSKAK